MPDLYDHITIEIVPGETVAAIVFETWGDGAFDVQIAEGERRGEIVTVHPDGSLR